MRENIKSIGLTEFVSKYGVVKMPDGTSRPFDNSEIEKCKLIEDAIKSGKKITLIKHRGRR